MSKSEGGLLHVRVWPRAARNEVVGWRDEALRVRVTAAPVDGQANRAVAALLAQAFDVPPSSVVLVRGESGRDKLFRIRHLSAGELRARLKGARA